MSIVLGLFAAFCWGAADFFARYATRIVGTYRTLFFMQLFGLVGLGAYILLTGNWHRLFTQSWQTWLITVIAIALHIISSLALYRAFEVGILTIVSPIAASYAAVTVLLAVLTGEVISPTHGIGLVATLIGVILAATPLTLHLRKHIQRAPKMPTSRQELNGIYLAIFSAVGYGIAFWLFGFRVAPAFGGVLPVWLIRSSTVGSLLVFAPLTNQKLSIPRGRVWWFLAGVGVLDTLAFVATIIGYTLGQVAIISVLASLFSAVTVLLAWVFLRDRLQWNQWFGIVIIFVGVVLVNI